MSISEPKAFARDSINIWRFDASRAVTTDVAVAEIVSVDQNNIRFSVLSAYKRSGQ